MTVHLFGVRHHGPGTARSLARALDALAPDCVLVEGPAEADALAPLVLAADMAPPVALVSYVPDQPRRAAFHPFAVFSPEWQAMTWAARHRVPLRFIDLPMAHQLADDAPDRAPAGDLGPDPLDQLADAAGFPDGETFWDQTFEQRLGPADIFPAMLEAMVALRAEVERARPVLGLPRAVEDELRREARREAAMRQAIRRAQAAGHRDVAVVVGAWHTPALRPDTWPPARADAALLTGLPKVPVACTWVPWSHARLATSTGYGAGVPAPAWYDHLFAAGQGVATAWLTAAARQLRDEGLDASPATVVDAVRLAEALAALRGRPLPGLDEVTEAAGATLCAGAEAPLTLLRRRLVLGDAIGRAPADAPAVPLQRDLDAAVRRLRLPFSDRGEDEHALELDLRRPRDLEKSQLLARCELLGLPWATREAASDRARGTFKEPWRLRWRPDLPLAVLDAARLGNTVGEAAAVSATQRAEAADALPTLTRLVDALVRADLPHALAPALARLSALAAVATDVPHLLEAVPPLGELLRYGDVRGTALEPLRPILAGLVTRASVGLPMAAASLDDDAARALRDRVQATEAALRLHGDADLLTVWRDALTRLLERPGLNGHLAGRVVRLLRDAEALAQAEAARQLSLALSRAAEPTHAAAWVEGFLEGGGLVLAHDPILFDLIDHWLANLPPEAFEASLPLLRRTFATFSPPERRHIGVRAARAAASEGVPDAPACRTEPLDPVRADSVLPVLRLLLGGAP